MTGTVRYRIRHETSYSYARAVAFSYQLLHLRARTGPFQTVLEQSVSVDPEPSVCAAAFDGFGNPVQRLEVDRPHDHLSVVAIADVEVRPRPQPPAAGSARWQDVCAELTYASGRPVGAEQLEAFRFRMESPQLRVKHELAEFAAECFAPHCPVLEGALALMLKLHREIAYEPGATRISTPLIRVLEMRRGVCQDFAHLMIGCLRSLGLAARYVSGYLRTEPPPDSPRLVGADASHAWVSVYCPPFGWIDLDPTNGVRVDTQHVTLAWGRDFSDVSPLRGVLIGGGSHRLRVAVTTTETGR